MTLKWVCNNHRFLKAFSVLALGGLLARPAAGSIIYSWTGNGADSKWSTAANWSGNTIPVDSTSAAGDADLIFGATATSNTSPDLDSGITIGSGAFNTFAITFPAGAAAFTLTDSSNRGFDMLGARAAGVTAKITNNSSNAQVITAGIVVRGDQNTSATEFAANSGAITASGVISSAGATAANAGIVKSGANLLTITGGSNSYIGPTLISAGSLKVNSAGRLGSTTNATTVTVQSTAIALDLSGATITAGVINAIPNTETLSLAGGGVAGTADNGYVILPAGSNEIVGGLTLAGVPQALGTYGSTSSLATFKNDEFFSGTGILTVVPEPGSAALLASIAGLGLIRRRRKV